LGLPVLTNETTFSTASECPAVKMSAVTQIMCGERVWPELESATTVSLAYRTHDVGVGLESGMDLRFVLKHIKCGSHDCGSGQPGDSRRQDILQLTFSTFQCFNQVVLFDDFASGLTT
jgi:hypothetical protein